MVEVAAAERNVMRDRPAFTKERAQDPRCSPLSCRAEMLERVTEAAFGQRRKMLRQSLKSLGTDPLPLLEQAGIAPTARAEDIPIDGFVALARGLEAVKLRA